LGIPGRRVAPADQLEVVRAALAQVGSLVSAGIIMKNKQSLPLILLQILAFEKFVQHMFITYGFIENLGGIRQAVSLDYRIFLISGFLVGLLFLLSFVLLIRLNRLSLTLLFFLALFDFLGEFVAQGTVFITITVSFLIATLLLLIIGTRRSSLITNTGQAEPSEAV